MKRVVKLSSLVLIGIVIGIALFHCGNDASNGANGSGSGKSVLFARYEEVLQGVGDYGYSMFHRRDSFVIPCDGVISDLYVRLGGGVGTYSVKVTVCVNDQESGVSVTYTDNDKLVPKSDTVHSVIVSAGDCVVLKYYNNGPDDAPGANATFLFTAS